MAPKILNLDHVFSNAEVLQWTEQKRAQHAREDAEDRAAGITPKPRPANFMRMLEKTERHLTSDAYPYVKNPSAYKGDNQHDSVHKFSDAKFDRIQKPIFERYKEAIRKGLMSTDEAKQKMGAEQEKKELTETELLMVCNHAPTCVEMLEPMIEEVEERFTKEELQIIVDCINEVLRADELKAKRKERKKEKKQAAKEAKKAAKEGGGEEESEVKGDDDGVWDMGEMTEAAR